MADETASNKRKWSLHPERPFSFQSIWTTESAVSHPRVSAGVVTARIRDAVVAVAVVGIAVRGARVAVLIPAADPVGVIERDLACVDGGLQVCVRSELRD